jgi:hypothetical protein
MRWLFAVRLFLTSFFQRPFHPQRNVRYLVRAWKGGLFAPKHPITRQDWGRVVKRQDPELLLQGLLRLSQQGLLTKGGRQARENIRVVMESQAPLALSEALGLLDRGKILNEQYCTLVSTHIRWAYNAHRVPQPLALAEAFCILHRAGLRLDSPNALFFITDPNAPLLATRLSTLPQQEAQDLLNRRYGVLIDAQSFLAVLDHPKRQDLLQALVTLAELQGGLSPTNRAAIIAHPDPGALIPAFQALATTGELMQPNIDLVIHHPNPRDMNPDPSSWPRLCRHTSGSQRPIPLDGATDVLSEGLRDATRGRLDAS